MKLVNRKRATFNQLKEHHYKIKEDGYAITRRERVKDSFAISSPLFDYTNEMISVLTIAGPIQRLTDERENLLVEKLLSAAREISKELGFQI